MVIVWDEVADSPPGMLHAGDCEGDGNEGGRSDEDGEEGGDLEGFAELCFPADREVEGNGAEEAFA